MPSLVPVDALSAGTAPDSPVLADLDGDDVLDLVTSDGATDIVVVDSVGRRLSLYPGHGRGGLAP